mmetsp:Transcript_117616/g.216540  ORF Transcript_117616/g.216540 Transcript_117616/m.216540 type:complete len:502 (+) Transcript_117616:3-1508(+)
MLKFSTKPLPFIKKDAKDSAIWDLSYKQTYVVEGMELEETVSRSGLDAYARYLLLRILNRMITESVIPRISLNHIAATPHGKLMLKAKRRFFPEITGKSAEPAGPVGPHGTHLTFDRFKAIACKESGECDLDGSRTIFGQLTKLAFTELQAKCFIQKDSGWEYAPFRVSFQGEQGQDQGGLYRNLLEDICKELMSPQLPIFLPSANHSTNSGSIRECWVLNPALDVNPGSAGERMLTVLGWLMGVCMLRRDVLPLYLSQLLWKGLLGDLLTKQDLKAVDHAFYQGLQWMQDLEAHGIDEESFERDLQKTFVIEDSAGQQVPLVPDGHQRIVKFNSAREYADLALDARLHEAHKQVSVLRSAIFEVAKGWAMWDWKRLEENVVGVDHIELSILKAKTRYHSYSESDEPVVFFWKAMESFSQDDLRNFLIFVWGRSRLPPSKDDPRWESGFQLKRWEAAGVEGLPQAHTCFFQLDMPPYPTEEIARAKIHFAISNCQTTSGMA